MAVDVVTTHALDYISFEILSSSCSSELYINQNFSQVQLNLWISDVISKLYSKPLTHRL